MRGVRGQSRRGDMRTDLLREDDEAGRRGFVSHRDPWSPAVHAWTVNTRLSCTEGQRGYRWAQKLILPPKIVLLAASSDEGCAWQSAARRTCGA